MIFTAAQLIYFFHNETELYKPAITSNRMGRIEGGNAWYECIPTFLIYDSYELSSMLRG